MKLQKLIISISTLLVVSTLAKPEEANTVFIQVEAKSKFTKNGVITTKILSAPQTTTKAGTPAEIKVVSHFKTSVPNYEDLTKQTEEGGVILTVTPHIQNGEIFLKGKSQILKVPIVVLDGDNGRVAVQESISVLFSLKLDGSTNPVEMEPRLMPDGSYLILSITAYEDTPEREEERFIKEHGEEKGKRMFAAKKKAVAEFEQKDKKSQQ